MAVVGAGVLVCEAFGERSEQRANKYPVATAIAPTNSTVAAEAAPTNQVIAGSCQVIASSISVATALTLRPSVSSVRSAISR